MNAGDELVDVVDEADRVTKQVTRREMREQKLRHRATYVLVFNSSGQLYVHKRTATKDVYPSYYDLVAGGVVAAGEDYDVGAVRELDEELGINGVDLRRLFAFQFAEDDGAPVNGVVYSCTWDGSIRWQESEVESGQWMDLVEVLELAQRVPICPDSLEALRLYLDRLHSISQRR